MRLEGRAPVLFFEIAATQPHATDTVLMYGHLDKQPEFSGWRSDLGPLDAQVRDGKLYGRGGADDGYAVYASIAAVQELKRQNVPHPRIVGLIETCEESSSRDLLPHRCALKPRLGNVALVVCLDSGAGKYDQLWLTTSLRGMASGTLKVEILTEGIHWRCLGPGALVVPHHAAGARPAGRQRHRPPPARQLPLRSARRPAWPRRAHGGHPGRRGVQALPLGALRLRRLRRVRLPTTTDPVQALLKRTWSPRSASPAPRGFPALQDAGNVLRPTPPSNSACACPRWWTPRRRAGT